jgi:uncharacterized membrane protein YbaN (DUF454 family)
MKPLPEVSAAERMIYGGLGWCAVGLAVVGVIVPGMPTTVFVLAASYCFSRSSPRFSRWLRTNPWLGPALQRVSRAGGMPPSAKRAALAAMWTAVLISSALLAFTHWAIAVGTIGLGAVGTLSIVWGVRTVPERRWRAAELATELDLIRHRYVGRRRSRAQSSLGRRHRDA